MPAHRKPNHPDRVGAYTALAPKNSKVVVKITLHRLFAFASPQCLSLVLCSGNLAIMKVGHPYHETGFC